MNPPHLIIIAAGITVFLAMLFMLILLSRYTKVGPNQVMIVSGRKVRLPDGRGRFISR